MLCWTKSITLSTKRFVFLYFTSLCVYHCVFTDCVSTASSEASPVCLSVSIDIFWTNWFFDLFIVSGCMHSVRWRCCLGVRKSIWPVNIDWWGIGVVICLERGGDYLHMVQLIPLHPKTPSSLASFKSRLVLSFWYQRLWSYDLTALYKSVYYYYYYYYYPGCPGKEAVKRV